MFRIHSLKVKCDKIKFFYIALYSPQNSIQMLFLFIYYLNITKVALAIALILIESLHMESIQMAP